MTFSRSHIRNFAVIAHIDHGKSTFSDRVIEVCGGMEMREMKSQILDSLDIERERGITIKAQCVRLYYDARDGERYMLNLMDTPGHADFSYEVDRCLKACSGSVLIVDLTQGVEAQTMANLYKAVENDHVIIIALNKADLPTANPDAIRAQIEDMTGLPADDAVLVSAKTGMGITDVLEQIVTRISPPDGDRDALLKCLLIDSWYDQYLGVIILVRVIDGVLKKRQKILMMNTGSTYIVENIGYFTPKRVQCEELLPGEIGFITAAIKKVADCKIGDTITDAAEPCSDMLPGFKASQPVVFCSLFPTDADQFEICRERIAKLNLNDASFTYELENSPALGYGFRCGFLGLLHLEVIRERLEREYDLDLITTYPSVVYHAYLKKGDMLVLSNPADMPDPTHIERIEEPWATVTIITPKDYLGPILETCIARRGEQSSITFNGDGNIAVVIFDLPLAEIVFDFYDRLKSISKGYSSIDWQISSYREADIIKLSIMINSKPVDPLSCLLHRSRSDTRGREICKKLKELIPRQMYKVAIQAAIGGKIIAREDVSAMRKDVTAKCYGGDVTRKKKLLEKQKKGKARMKTIGNVLVPKEAFIDVLKTD